MPFIFFISVSYLLPLQQTNSKFELVCWSDGKCICIIGELADEKQSIKNSIVGSSDNHLTIPQLLLSVLLTDDEVIAISKQTYNFLMRLMNYLQKIAQNNLALFLSNITNLT